MSKSWRVDGLVKGEMPWVLAVARAEALRVHDRGGAWPIIVDPSGTSVRLVATGDRFHLEAVDLFGDTPAQIERIKQMLEEVK